MTLIFLLPVLITAPRQAVANTETFEKALSEYKNGQYEQAAQLFGQALNDEPNNISILYNLGLSEFRQNQIGAALARWRRARNLDYWNQTLIQAEQKALWELKKKFSPQRLTTLDSVRRIVVAVWPPWGYLVILGPFSFLLGWVGLVYLGQRRRLQNESDPASKPALPISLFVIGSFWLLFFGLTIWQIADYLQPRGIVTHSVSAQSSPSKSGVELFSISPGTQVLIKDRKQNWVQVTYPGELTGWVSEDSVFHTYGMNPW